jgi:hypothetical protein
MAALTELPDYCRHRCSTERMYSVGMRFLVTPLRRQGRRVAQAHRAPPLAGNLVVMRSPYDDGTVRRQAFLETRLQNASNTKILLGPLLEPALIASGSKGLLLKGVSPEDGCEVVQEWWIQVEA